MQCDLYWLARALLPCSMLPLYFGNKEVSCIHLRYWYRFKRFKRRHSPSSKLALTLWACLLMCHLFGLGSTRISHTKQRVEGAVDWKTARGISWRVCIGWYHQGLAIGCLGFCLWSAHPLLYCKAYLVAESTSHHSLQRVFCLFRSTILYHCKK